MARIILEQSGAEALVAMFQHIDRQPAALADKGKRMLLAALARFAQWDGSHEVRITSGFHDVHGVMPLAWIIWKDVTTDDTGTVKVGRGRRVMNGEIVWHGDGEVLSHS